MTKDKRGKRRHLDALAEIIESRKAGDPDKSYVARLFSRGREKIAEKIGEEATEVVIAAVLDERKEIIAESADLLFHLMVLWSDAGIRFSDVEEVLRERKGLSGFSEKERRGKH